VDRCSSSLACGAHSDVRARDITWADNVETEPFPSPKFGCARSAFYRLQPPTYARFSIKTLACRACEKSSPRARHAVRQHASGSTCVACDQEMINVVRSLGEGRAVDEFLSRLAHAVLCDLSQTMPHSYHTSGRSQTNKNRGEATKSPLMLHRKIKSPQQMTTLPCTSSMETALTGAGSRGS
jgi:hypothetical protein